jgi:endoglucanase
MKNIKLISMSGAAKNPAYFIGSIIIALAAIFAVFGPSTSVAHAATSSVAVWWPTANAHMVGVQPLKAMVTGLSPSQYHMYWQVDGGQLNAMGDNATDYPHKESSVDVSTWHWSSAGTYTLTFVATDMNGAVIANTSVPVIVNPPSTSPTSATAQVSTTVTLAATPAPQAAVVVASQLYVNPSSAAAAQAAAWRSSRPADAAKMDILATQSTATWLGNWNSNVQNDVHTIMTKAAQTNTTPVFVAYNIPGRDCGGYSAGGAAASQYGPWIQSIAAGIGSQNAIVVLEPDALANITCLAASAQSERIGLLSAAITALKSNAHTRVYVDAGHAGWIDANTMASRLQQAGIAHADGFSLNVSNFDSSPTEVTYGTQVSQALGGSTHFVIDTSRNGNGPDASNWCNPSGRAIGAHPTLSTGVPLLDANLWIKTPGESDGTCNGGPSAGTWWADYALGLVK